MTDPVKQDVPQNEASEKDEKQERERSKIEFPYTALDLAITLAKAVHELGNQCDWGQLGARLGMAAEGGGFRQRLMAAKTFGLITYTSKTITLTPLGTQINDPDQLAAAKVEAFLKVPLYNRVFEQFRNGMLPGNDGLENAIVLLGVAQKQKDKARQAFQRSATEAGFFGYGPNRLVMPTVKSSKKPDTKHDDRGAGNPAPPGGGGGGGTPPELPPMHPFIKGLLDTLPPVASPAKTEWSLQERREWLQTAAGIFNLIYKANDNDNGNLVLTVVPLPPTTSAK